jgi:DNA ligase (NAD+)
MNTQELLSRYDQLIGISVACRKAYYEDGSSNVSDAGYDNIVDEIEELELLLDESYHSAKSPTRAVGMELRPDVGFDIVDHPEPMLSLAKSHSCQDIDNFDKSVRKRLNNRADNVHYCLERKYDGVALELIYIRGHGDDVAMLSQAILRGDGQSGEDVTANAMHIRTIPNMLSISLGRNEEFVVRGEIVATPYSLERTNQNLLAADSRAVPYKTTRHMATASLRQIDPNITKQRDITFIAYQFLSAGETLSTQVEALDCLLELGFITQPERTVVVSGHNAQESAHRMWNSITPNGKQDRFQFPCDGIVIKVNDLQLQDALGATAHHPNWALAYKFADNSVLSTITGVEYSMGRNGRLTPVLTFTPVDINGVIVSRATIANARMLEWQHWYIGAKADIALSGMCIPKATMHHDWMLKQDRVDSPIEDVAKSIVAATPEYFNAPKECPFCNQPTTYGDHQLICANTQGCEEQVVKRLVYFTSREAMGFKGFGEKMVRQAVSLLGLNNPNQFFELDVDKLKRMGLSSRTAFKMDNLIKSRTMRIFNEEPWRYLAGLCVPGIGLETARELISLYSNLASIKLRTAETIASTGVVHVDTAAALLAAMITD